MPTPLSDTTTPHQSSPDEWVLMVDLCKRMGIEPGVASRPSQWSATRALIQTKILDRLEALEAKSGG